MLIWSQPQKPNTNEVLIVTLSLGANYGGILQAYALQHYLRQLGYTVHTTSSSGPPLKAALKKVPGLLPVAKKLGLVSPHAGESGIATQKTREFISKHIQMIPFRQARKDAANCQAVVVGSDQVWRNRYSYLPHTYLNFVPNGITKISYAASFGLDNVNEYSAKEKADAKQSLSRFLNVSVREQTGVTICEDEFGVPAICHIDPTLLLTGQEYRELAASVPKASEAVFTYVLDPNTISEAIIDQVSAATRLKPRQLISSMNNEGIQLPAVEEWLASFRDASYVVTDSFHGTVFSILFNKPFVTIINNQRGATRMISLLEKLGLQDRLIEANSAATIDIQQLMVPIDWEAIGQKVQGERENSTAYLLTSIGAPS